MSKVTLTDLVNLQNEATAVASINANNAAIVAAIENTLSRNGTSPNQMSANLDMNSQKIINLPAPATSTEPVRLQDFQDLSLAAGSGNVTGVVSSTDMAIARFSGTSGKAIQNSGVTISDANLLTTTSLATTGAATVGTTLGVTGATTLGSTLGVTGAATLSSTLGVTGATTLGSTLGVTGVATFTATPIFVAGVTPSVSGTGSLGSSALMFDSLYLKNGGTINFNNGNVTITHSAGALAYNAALTSSSSIKSSSASAGIGYATGAGSTVTQLTSKSTGVTINTPTGQITSHNASLAASASAIFTVTNSSVAATDVVCLVWASGGSTNSYRCDVIAVAAGSFVVRIANTSAGPLAEALVFNFAVIKGVTS